MKNVHEVVMHQARAIALAKEDESSTKRQILKINWINFAFPLIYLTLPFSLKQSLYPWISQISLNSCFGAIYPLSLGFALVIYTWQYFFFVKTLYIVVMIFLQKIARKNIIDFEKFFFSFFFKFPKSERGCQDLNPGPSAW